MNPRGEIVDILAVRREHRRDHAILAEFGLPYSIPQNVEKARRQDDLPESRRRTVEARDFRGVNRTFTIDPRDAKASTNALRVRIARQLGNTSRRLHIADVTHYVQANTIIDKEAQKRATSDNISCDRTIPMLPSLSNGICSLRPDEEKLTFSAIFRAHISSTNGHVVNLPDRPHRDTSRTAFHVRRGSGKSIETGKGISQKR